MPSDIKLDGDAVEVTAASGVRVRGPHFTLHDQGLDVLKANRLGVRIRSGDDQTIINATTIHTGRLVIDEIRWRMPAYTFDQGVSTLGQARQRFLQHWRSQAASGGKAEVDEHLQHAAKGGRYDVDLWAFLEWMDARLDAIEQAMGRQPPAAFPDAVKDDHFNSRG